MVKHSYRMAINLKLTSYFAPAHTRTFRDIVYTVVNSSFRMTLGFMGVGGMSKQVLVEELKCLEDTEIDPSLGAYS